MSGWVGRGESVSRVAPLSALRQLFTWRLSGVIAEPTTREEHAKNFEVCHQHRHRQLAPRLVTFALPCPC
eukprot:scaffold269377_cov33-Tisochrysis_lutea.AAC.5